MLTNQLVWAKPICVIWLKQHLDPPGWGPGGNEWEPLLNGAQGKIPRAKTKRGTGGEFLGGPGCTDSEQNVAHGTILTIGNCKLVHQNLLNLVDSLMHSVISCLGGSLM